MKEVFLMLNLNLVLQFEILKLNIFILFEMVNNLFNNCMYMYMWVVSFKFRF